MYKYINHVRNRFLNGVKLFFAIMLLLWVGIAQVSRPVWGSRWSKTGDLTRKRCGYSGVGLTDGRVMVMATQYELVSGYEFFDPATGTWVWGDSLPPGTEGTVDHSLAMLLPNGKVMYKSSFSPQIWLYDPFADTFDFLSSASLDFKHNADATLLKDGQLLMMYDGQNCVLYDYDAITPTGAANYKHLNGIEVLLPSGKVLVIGGGNTPWGGLSDKCELYDAGSWNSAGSMNETRKSHVAILFPPPWDNKVLVTGGIENMMHPQKKECELYNIALDTWAYTDSVKHSPRHYSTMALLPSGKVMIMGGNYYWSSPKNNNQCEIYDPETEKWSDTDPMEATRGHNTSFILPTGKVLTASGVEKCELNYPDALTITAEIYDPSDGKWTGKPDLKVGRGAHTTTPLPIIPTKNCSTNVLIVGGENSSGTLASCELYNYSLDNVTLTDELTEARSHHTAVLLVSGQVLVAGGKDGATTRSSSELYDVPTQLWTTIGAMTNARFDHTATMLKNGDVLATGGEDAGTYLSSCELYNGSWTPQASMLATPRARHTAIILLNGNILVIGGQTTGGNATATCELWNGTTWTGKASMSTARYWHTATLLQSGKVLVAGGTSNGGTPLSSYEIYDPNFNSWTTEGNLNTARFQHNTTLLYSGLVLVTGGNGGVNSCETYDPATHKWTTDYTGTLATGRAYHSSVLIPDTMPFILAIGGKDGGGGYIRSIEEYDVGLEYRQIWQSEITNYPSVTLISDPMNIDGALFRGVSEADGGNYCHIANNDHPIISLVRIGGGNWQGNGGGEILHMPLSSSWDEIHTDVHPEITDFQGYYRLWSIVNGIPCKWYPPCPAGTEEKTGIRDKATGISVTVYPNPSTIGVRFQVLGAKLSSYQAIKLSIYDLSGRLVRSLLITDNQTPNTEITWDRRNGEGKKVKSGIYFYRLNCKDFEIKGKFVILK